MRIKLTSAQMATKMFEFGRVWQAEIIAAEALSIADAKKEAEELSSGPHSLSDLAKAGHPYSRRKPQPKRYPANIINKQSGKFNKAWRTIRPRVSGMVVRTVLMNIDPKAKFMKGTKLMVPRLIIDEVKRRIMRARKKRLREAKQIAIRKVFK